MYYTLIQFPQVCGTLLKHPKGNAISRLAHDPITAVGHFSLIRQLMLPVLQPQADIAFRMKMMEKTPKSIAINSLTWLRYRALRSLLHSSSLPDGSRSYFGKKSGTPAWEDHILYIQQVRWHFQCPTVGHFVGFFPSKRVLLPHRSVRLRMNRW